MKIIITIRLEIKTINIMITTIKTYKQNNNITMQIITITKK
jgi:hypothetical protein